jgi:hypothetical protein
MVLYSNNYIAPMRMQTTLEVGGVAQKRDLRIYGADSVRCRVAIIFSFMEHYN